ncbi:UNVERIFIED_CONTAM: hypothetical protein Slati_2115800 [Sesamum latifolium]|uniref:Uncharacterized protein n=1 Tax=Sesamum latifolium TaxID=2727402 RepID=A0AAW2WRN0_9LAMI
MLYWKNDIDLDYCKFCAEARYKPTRERSPNCKKTPYAIIRYLPLTPRLRRLYASEATAEQMTWHANHQMEEGSICHPSDAKVWRHFYRAYLDFAAEPRNFRLDLCTDGFGSHELYNCTYSCWPVILTPYNHPPEMCMSSKYLFLTMVIPGPSNSKYLIDVYLEPLIEKLQNLWHVDVLTLNSAKNETYTSPSPHPPSPPSSQANPAVEDRIDHLEEMMVDIMAIMREMRASSTVGSSQPTASTTAPAQPPTDPQAPNDEKMDVANQEGGLD